MCKNNFDWWTEISKERHRLLAVYLLNFFVVQLVNGAVRSIKALNVKINNVGYTILSSILN